MTAGDHLPEEEGWSMSGKKKEYYKKLGAEYFDAERELVSKKEYEAGPVQTKWVMPACIIMCVATFWAISRLTNMIGDIKEYTWWLVGFVAALLVGVSLYNLTTYLLLRFAFHVPKEKMCMYRRLIRVECGCRAIVKRTDLFIAEIVPFLIFIIMPIALEFILGTGWFLCYGVVMCACQMMNIYYMIQVGVSEETAMAGIIPGSGELRVYVLRKDKKKIK